MKTLFIIATGLILLIVIVGAIVFFLFPKVLVDQTNASYARSANLKKKSIEVNDYKVNYYENESPNKPKFIMLHGMGDDKNSFLQTAKFLSKDYHIILPDLAGHGENERKKGFDYSIDGQAFFLKSFLEELEISRFNLIGNSMGGHTAAAYAIKYQDDVKNLILLNAAGIKLDEHIVYTGFGKEIKSKTELNAVLERVFYKAPKLPGPIANYMLESINNSKDFVDLTLVPAIKNGKYFNLKNDVQTIKSQTLILWGKHDNVVKFNVAEYFQDSIPNSKLKLIEKASHSPQLEVPEIVAKEIIDFLNQKSN